MKDNLKDNARSLRDFEISPRPFAWERIQNKLEEDKKKSKAFFWWARAAVILLIGLSGYSWLTTDSDSTDEIGKNSYPVIQPSEEVIEYEKPKMIAESRKLETPELVVEKAVKNTAKNNQKKNKASHDSAKKIQKEEIAFQEINQEKIFAPERLPFTVHSETLISDSINQPKEAISIVIEYKAGSKISSELLAKEDHKKSQEDQSLKKIIDKVREVNGEKLSLAYLREAKDDLFDLDLSKFRAGHKSENN